VRILENVWPFIPTVWTGMADPVETKNDRQCHKCRREFRDPSTLRRHMGRKRPCAPVVDREDLPPVDEAGGKCLHRCHCRFCGRPYSNQNNVRRHLKSCPIAARGERGMDELYAHVLERTRRAQEAEAAEAAAGAEVAALRAELEQTRLEVARLRGNELVPAGGTVVYAPQNTFVTTINVATINVFGREETAHITTASVRDILARCCAGGTGEAGGQIAAAQALLQAALLIYSDPDRPGNITCYIPNKRDGNALVHGARGWEIKPAPLVLPPMAQTSLNLLFDKQPYDEDAEQCVPGLQLLRDHEQELTAGGAGLHAVLIRNKGLLSRVLSQLPLAGEQQHLKFVEGGVSSA
jgi:hypothetical protein